jgi:Primase X
MTTKTEVERLLLDNRVTEGLDFILSHLKEPIWPRTISTKSTEGRQIPVYSKQQALAWYKSANFLDCRISAYPYYYYNANGNVCRRNRQRVIDLVMIDLDQSTFKSRQSLDRAKSKTLKKIQDTFGTEFELQPTVIWSGNGYHIYIPMESRYILEDRPEFSKYEEPSKQFLRFAEWYLSDGKADSNHYKNVSFGNCMLRIPGSHNSKCVAKNNHVKVDSSTEVRIIKEWNGNKERAPIYLLIDSFLAYLVDQDLKERQRQRQKQFSKYDYGDNNNKPPTKIPWIEKLLQTPLADHRKYCIWRILSPYLVKVRDLCYEESFAVITGWLDKCNNLEKLNFNAKIKINDGLKRSSNGYYPIGLEKLKEENKKLYDIVIVNKDDGRD